MSPRIRLPRIPVPAAFRPVQPALAASIGERSFELVRLGRSGSRAALLGFWSGEIPEGAVRCSAVEANLADAGLVTEQVRLAKARVSPAGGPVALCLPDPVARVALLQLESMPARATEIQELVAWRLKKQLPYRVDEARVSWQVLGSRGAASLVLAAAIRRRVLAEYEDLLTSAGFSVGSVTTSSLALAESLPADGHETLLVHVSDGWFTLLWTDGRQPVLVRTKHVPDSERHADARDGVVAAELAPTIEYATARLGRPALGRLLVHDATGQGESLRERLAGLTTAAVETLRPCPAPPGFPAVVAARLGAACCLAARGLGEGLILAGEAA